MIKFFSKIRQNLIQQNKTGKYLKYAIGEIFLVVIGILIALQVNNWNEIRKEQNRVATYKQLMKIELKEDLKRLEFLQNYNDSIRNLISSYLEEYHAKKPNIDRLKQMNISEAVIVNIFTRNSLTVDEVVTNGSLALFSPEIKQAIAKLKDYHDLFGFYQRESFLRVIKSFEERVDHIDLLYEKGYSLKPHPTGAEWYADVASENYRRLNNSLAQVLDYYDYQENTVFKKIEERTTHLLMLLEEK